MLIFIDTNIFFNHWFLRAPMFELLANYVSNEKATLLVSEVVCEEVNAKFRVERASAFNELSKASRRVRDLQASPKTTDQQQAAEDYDFRSILKGRFENLQFVPFDAVPHTSLVSRAINVVRPFREKEKGYRDSLMWLSLLDYLKVQHGNSGNVAFINANSNDFFQENPGAIEELKLHQHLMNDLDVSGFTGVLKPYLSIKEFADAEIDKLLHSVKHEEVMERHAEEIEHIASASALEYLQMMPLHSAQELLIGAGLSGRCARAVRDFTVEIFEGVEDPELTSLSAFASGGIYIEYRFNFRTVIYTVEVSTEDYLANIDEFNNEFINIDKSEYVTCMETYARIDIEASLTFNPTADEVTSIAIDRSVPRVMKRAPH